jgi:hypothetical protein
MIAVLEHEEFGAAGVAAAARAREFAKSIVGTVLPLLGPATAPCGRMVVRESPVRGDDVDALLRSVWSEARGRVDGAQRAIVISPHLRELEVFGAQVTRGRDDAWAVDAMGRVTEGSAAPGLVVLVAPNLWTEEVAASVFRAVAPVASRARFIALPTVAEREACARSAAHRAVLELATGVVVPLPPAAGRESERPLLMAALLAASVAGSALDDDARTEVAGYEWPGGLAELENVVAELRHRGAGRVTGETLAAIGWRERVVLAGASKLPELPRRILAAVGREGSAGIGDITLAAGRPGRTVLRAVGELVAEGRLTRTGKGRATRYRIGRGPAAAPD